MIIDDVLATGGTVEACARLIEKLGAVVSGASFVIELSFLKGRERLNNYRVDALIDYKSE